MSTAPQKREQLLLCFVSNGMDAPVKRHRVCQSGRCDANHYKQRSVQDDGYGDWD
jgi:hypothetical protein